MFDDPDFPMPPKKEASINSRCEDELYILLLRASASEEVTVSAYIRACILAGFPQVQAFPDFFLKAGLKDMRDKRFCP